MNSVNQRYRLSSYAVITRRDAVLLCRISESNPHAGHWTLPGGGIDFGEHPVDACAREVLEESGLSIRVGPLLEVDSELFTRPDEQIHVIRFLYQGRVLSGELTPETDGSTDLCAWVAPTELPNLQLVPVAELGVRLAQGLSGL